MKIFFIPVSVYRVIRFFFITALSLIVIFFRFHPYNRVGKGFIYHAASSYINFFVLMIMDYYLKFAPIKQNLCIFFYTYTILSGFINDFEFASDYRQLGVFFLVIKMLASLKKYLKM